MSQLDQAKKEAKRLFNLAKNNQHNDNTSNNSILIENLSKAKEILSIINGYKSWHEYEQVLKRKDFIFDKVDKSTINKENNEIFHNQETYIQDMVFHTIKKQTITDTVLVVEKEHTNIIMGRNKNKKLFKTEEKKWILNEYPLLITACTGAGKTETLLSMSSQYIKNKEGLIFMDGKGDNLVYYKMFSYANQFNRLNDLFCLNFMPGNRNILQDNNEQESISHSIDPINPMLGSDSYFKHFFGRFGIVIHAILKELHEKNQLMDIESLESIFMLNNLIEWNKNKKFNAIEISDYLIDLGLSLEDNNDDKDFSDALLKHAETVHEAYKIVKTFKKYSYVFKLDCSINMEKIFLERKILLVTLPALEKHPIEIAQLGELIVSQIKHIEEKYQKYNIHFQNIIIDDFYYFADNLQTVNINKSKNNYIFGCSDYYHSNDIYNYVLNNSNTYVMMKTYDTDIPNKVKLDLINNIESILQFNRKCTSEIFIRNFPIGLRDLREGEAYILSRNFTENTDDIINNDNKYYCEYITCEYLPAKKENKTWLVKHPKPIIYIQEK